MEATHDHFYNTCIVYLVSVALLENMLDIIQVPKIYGRWFYFPQIEIKFMIIQVCINY